MNVEDIRRRGEVRSQVTNCTGCHLRTIGTQPVPFDGMANAPVAIIGQAPTRQDDTKAKVFTDSSGLLLRSWLDGAGFTRQDVSFLTLVACWPNGQLSKEAVRSCRVNLTNQLQYLSPKYLLVLGDVVLNALLSPVKIPMAIQRGKWFRVEGLEGCPPITALPTWDPWTVQKNQVLQNDVLQDLLYLRRAVETGYDPWEFIEQSWCWMPGCGNELDVEFRGVYACSDHPFKLARDAGKVKGNDGEGDSAGSAGVLHEPSGAEAGRLL